MDFEPFLQHTSLLLTIAGALIIVYVLQILVSNLQLPAGPWGLPFVGYQPFVGADPLESYNKFAKKYGEVFSIKIGSQMNIILSSYEMNREVFVKNSDNFTGIVQEFNVMNYVLRADATFFQDEGESWKEQRRFFMASLRDFGVGRLKTEKNIQNEAEHILHYLRDSEGKPIDFVTSYLLRLMTFNVASTVSFGQRFEYDDSKLRNFIERMDEFIVQFFENALYLDRFPVLRFLPHTWTNLGKIVKQKEMAFSFFEELVKEHEDTFDKNNIRDITDLYIKRHMEIKASGQDPEKTIFSKDSIFHNVAFLATAAMEDTSVALSWILKLAAKHPGVQKKMQDELDRVVGRQRLPSWTDKGQLPYMEAFLCETLRFSTFLPTGAFHTNYEKAVINGYTFPKRSTVITNYWYINRDQQVWGDPEEFRPERFIGEDGKITKLKERVLCFGSGNRSCPGESLARMQIFAFVSAMIQSFTLRPPPEEDFNFDCTPGNQRRLLSCVLCAEPRD